MKRRSFLLGATALLASPMLMASTSLPPGTIKITVGWAPGGGTDVFARIVGNKLSELWGRPVVVENKPGATGMLAAEQFRPEERRVGKEWVRKCRTRGAP